MIDQPSSPRASSDHWDMGLPDGIITAGELIDGVHALLGDDLSTPHEYWRAQLRHEESIQWVAGFDPREHRYVRENLSQFEHRRRGRPGRWDKRLVGWSNLEPDAPNNGTRGYFCRRLFTLEPHDAPTPGVYMPTGAPTEAVDPFTVDAGEPGRLTERAWGTHPKPKGGVAA